MYTYMYLHVAINKYRYRYRYGAQVQLMFHRGRATLSFYRYSFDSFGRLIRLIRL